MAKKTLSAQNSIFIAESDWDRSIIEVAHAYNVNIKTGTGREVERVETLADVLRSIKLAEAAYGDVNVLVYAMGNVSGIERGSLAISYNSRRKAFKTTESLAVAFAAVVDKREDA